MQGRLRHAIESQSAQGTSVGPPNTADQPRGPRRLLTVADLSFSALLGVPRLPALFTVQSVESLEHRNSLEFFLKGYRWPTGGISLH